MALFILIKNFLFPDQIVKTCFNFFLGGISISKSFLSA